MFGVFYMEALQGTAVAALADPGAAAEAALAAARDGGITLGSELVPKLSKGGLRLGWIAYDAETPRRVVILDQWRQHAVWERKCRNVVLKMNNMKQYMLVAKSFHRWMNTWLEGAEERATAKVTFVPTTSSDHEKRSVWHLQCTSHRSDA
jgi:hypothetical protein